MKTGDAIYLDYNATTPVDPEVFNAMEPYLREHFGNPSSSHLFGARAREAVERARGQVAGLLGCGEEEIVFTSGGTESNNFAIRGAALANRRRGNHIITCAIEHPAVMEVCRDLEAEGFSVTVVPVDGDGLVDPREVEKAVRRETILITIMHANNEVGTIEPVDVLSDIARRHRILIHTDAAQSAGKIPAAVDDLGVDMLSVAGHKLYAPKGIGALFIRRGVEVKKLIHGAGHEMNRRAGTENVPAIAGLGAACEIAARDMRKNMEHMKAMRDRLLEGLKKGLDRIRLNGHPEKRLPNTLSVGFLNIEAQDLLSRMQGVAASAGAACHAGAAEGSPVLPAMNVPPGYAIGTVRFSTGRGTTPEEIDRALDAIVDAVGKMRM